MSTTIQPTATLPEAGLGLTFLPTNPPTLVVDHGGTVQLWSLDGERAAKVRLKRGGKREYLTLGVHETRLAGGIKTVRISDLHGEELGPPLASKKYCTGLGFSPDGDLLAVGFDHLRLVEVATGELRWRALAKQDLGGMAFSPDGSRLLATTGAAGVHLLEVATGEVLARHEGHYIDARARPQGGYLVVGFRGEILELDEAGAAHAPASAPLHDDRPLFEYRCDDVGTLHLRPGADRSWSDASFVTGLALRNELPLIAARPGTAPNKVSHARLADIVLPRVRVGFDSSGRGAAPQAISSCGQWMAFTVPNATLVYRVSELIEHLPGE